MEKNVDLHLYNHFAALTDNDEELPDDVDIQD